MPVVIGKKYTKLIPVYELEKRTQSRGKIYHCLCDCGNELDVPGVSLTTGNTKSCGCIRYESAKAAGERIRKRNKYDLSGPFGIGWASNTNTEFYFDLEDYDIIKNYHWMEKGHSGYIVTKVWDNNKPSSLFMHRLVLEKNGHNIIGFDVDHKNHITYDNQKANLRVCDHYKNITASKTYNNNTSGRKGVYWDKEKGKWAVYITFNKKTKFVGRYEKFDDAVKAREEAEKIYHQEFHYDDIGEVKENELPQ